MIGAEDIRNKTQREQAYDSTIDSLTFISFWDID